MVPTEAGDEHPTQLLISGEVNTMKRSSSSSLTTFASVAILMAPFSTAVWASPAPTESQPPHMTVKYGDLNLSTREGIDTLYQRIKGAAHTVCDESIQLSDPFRMGLWRSCYYNAVANAVAKVNNPLLTIRHEQNSNRRVG